MTMLKNADGWILPSLIYFSYTLITLGEKARMLSVKTLYYLNMHIKIYMQFKYLC